MLQDQRVDGLLSVTWEKQVEQTTQYVGRGRGAVHREKRVIQKTRYHITHIARQADPIAALRQRFGWKAFVTNATPTQLSLQEAVLCYRHEYRVERIFNRLKSRVHIAPLFVKLNDQIEGLTYLLTLGVRVLTVMEFVLRRSLQTDQTKLPGLHPENKQKMTDKPTAERILKAFADVSLTIIKNAAGEEILRRLTPLSGLQEDILQRLIGKYLSGLRKLDHVVIAPKAGFESQLRAARVPITFGMRALGMTSQIRDGRLYRGIEPRHVPDLQGLDNPA